MIDYIYYKKSVGGHMNPNLPVNHQDIDMLPPEYEWSPMTSPCPRCGNHTLYQATVYDTAGDIDSIIVECDECEYQRKESI